MRKGSWFVIVTYPHEGKIGHLLEALDRKRVKVIKNTIKRNLGFGGGANEGIKYVLKRGAEWVIILNQDVSLSKHGVKEFVKSLRRTPAGIMGPETGSLDKKRWTSIFPAKGQIDYVTGSCMAIHGKVIKKIGGFYEPYFMYFEDVDVCARAKKAGFPIQKLNMLDFVHNDQSIFEEGSYDHEYYLARNHLLFVERNAPLKVKIHEFARLLKTFYEHRRNGNIGAEHGVRDYMVRRFGRRDT